MTYPENIRAAFREVALGLMEWREPPEHLTRSQIRADMDRYGHIAGWNLTRSTYRPYDPQGEVEPFNVQADWDERS